jgi:hypothetical protein
MLEAEKKLLGQALEAMKIHLPILIPACYNYNRKVYIYSAPSIRYAVMDVFSLG